MAETRTASLQRIRDLTLIEAETRRQLDDEVRTAREDLGLSFALIARAAGLTDTAIRNRASRGWIRTGHGGYRPGTKGTT